MAFKSSDSQNSEGRNRGGKDQKKKMKKMRSIKLPKLSSLNSSSSRRATWQFDLSAIDLAIDELNSMESSDSKKENFEVESESEDTSASPSRNPKSKSDQTPDNSSPHDPKNSNTGGKIAMKNFTRTPSIRTVRILKSKASFKSKRPLIKKQSKDLNVERATCSSTLKDSKFSKEIEHFEGEDEAEKISAMKICPYHHCSLHGHCHGSEPVEKKPFLRRKRRPMKTEKSKRRENEERDGGEVLFGGNSKSEKILVKDDFAAEKEHGDLSFTGKGQENGVGDMRRILFGGKQRSGKIFQQNEDENAGEILFGEKSLSEKSFLENKGGDAGEILFDGKSQHEKSSQENEGGDAGEIFCVGKSQPKKRFEENEDGDAGEILLGGKSQPGKSLQENKGGDAGKIPFGRKSKSGKIFQEILNQTSNLPDPQLKKENSISMWHLIHRQMVSGLKEDNFEENQEGNSNNFSPSKESLSRNISDADMSSEESEVRKNFAVKLVREAIEKILLPEVQDHSPDDQSISEQENSEEIISISTESSKQEKARENEDNGEEKKGESSEKRVPKSWSYLKKVILLKRFVKELQKVREFTPRKVQPRPLDLDQEGEKVSLRPQTTSGKKNSEEWMLDYAIRKVVSELAPNQKRKVSLLVKAFETVAPSQEDQPIYKVNATKIKGNYHQDFESNEVGNVVLTSNFDSSEKITKAHKGKNREFSTKDENDVLSSSSKCNVFEENNAKIEEKGDSTLTKDSDDVTEENGAISLSPNFQVPEEIKAQMEDKKGDCKEVSDPIKDSEDNRSENRAFKLRVKRENRVSMWHLIHEQMVSGLAAESGTDSLSGADEEQRADDVSTTLANNGIESEEIKMRKSFAIKLVREAIEKILLPEVQDQSFDDQSITSDVTSDQDPNEKNRDEDFERHKANNMEDERSIEAKDESRKENSEGMKTERMEGSKSEKQKPKSWSYLRKVILLKRFVKELEKVKKFNPRKPNFLPLQPEQEDEKVSLRPQTVGEKRNTDEWMLDYAIRQVVSQLAPTQKRKVALLVKAFETVAPPNEEHPKIDSQSSGKFAGLDDKSDIKSNVSEKIVSSSSFDLDVQVIDEHEQREVKSRGFEPKIKLPVEKQDNIKMWHMVYQHVVSGIAEKVVGDDESDEKSQHRLEFSKSDAVKLVQEAVDEILDDSSETQSTSGDSITTRDDCQSPASDVITSQEEGKDRVIVRNEKQKSKNWSKLKKLILLKRSIKALGNVRKQEDPKPPKILAVEGDDVANEKVDLRSQMVDERKKAEQWMLDYAVQHIVTKLTPDRKRRVAMLVEAFEAVVPLPET